MKKFFKMSRSHTIALSFMTLSAVAAQAYAGTITVCPNGSCNFTDPVAAIAAAAPNDIIEIHAGTYMLSSIISISITLFRAQVILDCLFNHSIYC